MQVGASDFGLQRAIVRLNPDWLAVERLNLPSASQHHVQSFMAGQNLNLKARQLLKCDYATIAP